MTNKSGKRIHILNVVGTRPNLMKIVPLIGEMDRHEDVHQTLVHTGQHYDDTLSKVFFEELDIPQPNIYLDVGSGSHAVQTAKIMISFERVLQNVKPDLVLVVGDVNSTLACVITASKLWIPTAHVEAGLRSFDRRMPEEINRIVTDALSDYLYATSRNAVENLVREGIEREKVFFVGNVMIDTLLQHQSKAKDLHTCQRFNLEPRNYALLTLHRPSNVDDKQVFKGIIRALLEIQSEIPIVFPVHPRTRNRLEEFDLLREVEVCSGLQLTKPLGYLPFLDLMMHSRFVLTDSGGIQEETTILNIPCLTLRKNTERPVTVNEGTNKIVGSNPERIMFESRRILNGHIPTGRPPELWDGHAAERIVNSLRQLYLS